MRFHVATVLLVLSNFREIHGNATSPMFSPNLTHIFRMMFEAQNRFRIENYQKTGRIFEKDWGNCDEMYLFPKCCLWEEKRRFARTTSDCYHIKGDVILDNDHDANVFQSFVDILEIQGSLVLRNTTLLTFGLPNLRRVGFSAANPRGIPAALTIQNNARLRKILFTRLQKIEKHKTQKYGLFTGNDQLDRFPEGKQFQTFRMAAKDGDADFDVFRPKRVRFVRHLLSELYPYFLIAVLIVGIFLHHFIMLEVNETRVKKKETEMIDCLAKMRDSTLAAELLIQTPSDVVLSFEEDVLHLCTDQVELVKRIKKLLEMDVKAFRDQSLEEVDASNDPVFH